MNLCINNHSLKQPAHNSHLILRCAAGALAGAGFKVMITVLSGATFSAPAVAGWGLAGFIAVFAKNLFKKLPLVKKNSYELVQEQSQNLINNHNQPIEVVNASSQDSPGVKKKYPNLFQKHRLLVTTFEQGGLGDLAALKKIIAILQRHLSQEQILCCIQSKSMNAWNKMYPHSLNVLELSQGSNEDVIKKINDFAPTHIVGFRGFSELDRYFPNSIPYIRFNEYSDYGIRKENVYTLGPAHSGTPDPDYNALGIFFDQDLADYFGNQKNEDSAFRIKSYCSQLSDNMFELVIGEKKKQSNNQLEAQLKIFSEKNRIYFGYTSYSNLSLLEPFIGACIKLNKDHSNEKENLVFVFPDIVTSADFNLEILKEAGINELVVKNHQWENTEIIEINRSKGAPKRITIISGKLTNQDFLTFLKASENEVILTGDQSLTEGLILGKHILYSLLPHKSLLAKSIAILIKESSGLEIDFGQSGFSQSSYRSNFSKKEIRDHIKKIAQYFNKIKRDKWKRFIEAIHQQDCSDKILDILIKTPSCRM